MIEGSSGVAGVSRISQEHLSSGEAGKGKKETATARKKEFGRKRIPNQTPFQTNRFCLRHADAPQPPYRQMPVSFHTPVHLPGTQRAASSHCLWPRPLFPFNAACTTTKGDKLGRRLDDRVTNPFGKTNSISGPHSWTS